VYQTTPGQSISKSALREFRTNILNRDDVFQPKFCQNVVFYGANKTDIQIEPDAVDELAIWNTKKHIFIAGNPAVKVAPGPYVFFKKRTWQPWRIYYDFKRMLYDFIQTFFTIS